MSTLIIEAKTPIISAPIADETQKRFENEVAGTPGETYTEFKPWLSGGSVKETRIGFQPPAERNRIEALLAELHTFLNSGKPDVANDQPQTT